MYDFFYSFTGFIVVLGILITVHEFGHFWVARKMGVKVLKFSVGFGPALWSRKGKTNGTEYVLAAIPLGGYVKMLDENEADVDDSEKHLAFNNKSLSKRAAVVIAGPLFNFLFAVLAILAVYIVGMEGIKPIIGEVRQDSVADRQGVRAGDIITRINGRPNRIWGENNLYLFNQAIQKNPVEFTLLKSSGVEKNVILDLSGLDIRNPNPSLVNRHLGLRIWLPPARAIVGKVQTNTPAAAAGLQAEDEVVTVNGQDIEGWAQMVAIISQSAGKPVSLEIIRRGRELAINLIPEPVEIEGRTVGRIGIELKPQMLEFPEEMQTRLDYGLFESVYRSVETTWLISAVTLRVLSKMVFGEVSTRSISGPITIARFAGVSVQRGIDQFLLLLATISISLGVLNLLPIPILDGGHLLYYAIEAVRNKPVSREFMERGQQVGIVILLGLMSLAFYNDILGLLG